MLSILVGVTHPFDPASESARVILRPGKNRDGYFTNNHVIQQLRDAVAIVKKEFPNDTHVFIYDNAPSHTRRPPDSVSARHMPKSPTPSFLIPGVDESGKEIKVRMEDALLENGTRQSFYFPDHDRKHPGWFKGMARILHERGLYEVSKKRAECPGFKCEDTESVSCCCRRALFNQPDFKSRDSALEEAARALGVQVLFLPKYHCELNPIEQCWGFAKKIYRETPASSKESVLIERMLEAIGAVPRLSMCK